MESYVLKSLLEKGIRAIQPHYDGIHSMIVYTHQGNIKLVETAYEVMDQICQCFGSDLQGRMNGTRKKFGYRKQPPVLISELSQLVALQIPSEYADENTWIWEMNFKIEEEIGQSKSKIILDENLSFEVDLSKSSIEEKRTRAIDVLFSITYFGGTTFYMSKRSKSKQTK
ncbi:ComK protein OS=Ureibacillus acetophenoni OX=614649 GN=SAMN05877842_101130 PE=4 SV=1 [Ureibacillus acetophenoni]